MVSHDWALLVCQKECARASSQAEAPGTFPPHPPAVLIRDQSVTATRGGDLLPNASSRNRALLLPEVRDCRLKPQAERRVVLYVAPHSQERGAEEKACQFARMVGTRRCRAP